MDLTSCPECAAPAEVLGREAWPSTDGPVEHARVRCVRRHLFHLPVERVATGAPRVDAGERAA